MDVRKLGIVFSALIGTALLVAPFTASARPLTLGNATKKPFTVRINNICSSDVGVIKANTTKIISEEILNKLCGQNASACKAQIFKSNDCNGKEIADFIFDTKKGVTDVFHSSTNYSMTVSYSFNAVTLVEAI